MVEHQNVIQNEERISLGCSNFIDKKKEQTRLEIEERFQNM
jgi:hypothetical protein